MLSISGSCKKFWVRVLWTDDRCTISLSLSLSLLSKYRFAKLEIPRNVRWYYYFDCFLFFTNLSWTIYLSHVVSTEDTPKELRYSYVQGYNLFVPTYVVHRFPVVLLFIIVVSSLKLTVDGRMKLEFQYDRGKSHSLLHVVLDNNKR